ncbi:MAG: quinol monooxygenase YgiN, partial [Gammaproteobacteria bacterium]
MLIITGIIKASSETELNRVKNALINRAVRSRQDEGNIDYAFSVNIEDPTEIRLTEKWESEALLNAHLAIP